MYLFWDGNRSYYMSNGGGTLMVNYTHLKYLCTQWHWNSPLAAPAWPCCSRPVCSSGRTQHLPLLTFTRFLPAHVTHLSRSLWTLPCLESNYQPFSSNLIPFSNLLILWPVMQVVITVSKQYRFNTDLWGSAASWTLLCSPPLKAGNFPPLSRHMSLYYRRLCQRPY